VELTNEDVADILALLDSLPYDELDLETPRFRLTLRRSASGGWTQERQVTADPEVAGTPATAPPSPPPAADPAGSGPPRPARDRGQAGGIAGAAGNQAGGPASADTAAGGAGGAEAAGTRLVDVAAPLPGTFYRAPRPGAAPFVEVGSRVSADTVVAIVETMKLMNSVHAGTAGRIAAFLAGNGEVVAQGAALIRIEPEQA
jgi:acetyl-CoA carboxylase biotin carboxyl carrier protein